MIDNKLDTTIEWSKSSVNLRSVSNEDLFNTYNILYKNSNSEKNTALNKKKLIQIKRDLDFTSSKLRNKRRSFKKRQLLNSSSSLSNFSLDTNALIFSENMLNSLFYLKTNNKINLKIEFNKLEKIETYINGDSKELFRVQYNDLNLPISFSSFSLLTTSLTYDNNGRLLSWKRGNNKLKEEYVYDLKGRLIEIKYNNGDSLKYSYAEGIMVSFEIFKNINFVNYFYIYYLSLLQLHYQIEIIMYYIVMMLVTCNK